MTDEQLIAMYWSGQDSAFDDLVTRYAPIIQKYCRSFYLRGAVQNDLFQEGYIGLYTAMLKYKECKGDFRPFARIHIKNSIINAVRAATRCKHMILNDSCSLHASYITHESDSKSLMELLPSCVPTPEEIVLHRERIQEREGYVLSMMDVMTPMERNVFGQFLQGGSYIEVAEKVGIPCKSVDNAIYRIKQKIKKFKKSQQLSEQVGR